jgi:hypothetical protein
MSTFVRIYGSTPKLELDIKELDSVDYKTTPNGYGLQLMGGTIIYLSGKNEGEVCMDGKLAANQNVEIRLGTIKPKKREVFLTYNPVLRDTCQVSCPMIFAPHEEQYLTVTLSSFKATDLTELEWVVRLYIAD